MSTIYKDLGPVTAYAYAVAGGYVGTEAQFQALLGNIAEDLSNIENLTVTVTTLPAGSSATASYADGVLSLGIPKGDTGEQGEQGEQGDEGVGIGAVIKTGTSGNVDTYTVYSNESTPQALGTFTVTNSDVVPDGNYPNMTVGNAEQLVATVGIEDKVPYLFRTSGGAADIGDRETDTVVGGSVAWNQQMPDGNFTGTGTVSGRNGTATVSGNVATLVPDGTQSSTLNYGIQIYPSEENLAVGHKYFATIGCKSTKSDKFRLRVANDTKMGETIAANTWGKVEWVTQVTGTSNLRLITCYAYDDTLYTTSDALSFRQAFLIDLTQMFGSTIADYIYNLESGTAGAGVAWLKKYCPKMFSTYQAYNAGELLSVKTTAHETVGFNAWDEEWEVGTIDTATGQNASNNARIRSKNYIPVVPGATYYIKMPTANSAYMIAYAYDANKNFIEYKYKSDGTTLTVSSNTSYLRFTTVDYGTTYGHDICINLHWDGERDGEYEPYVKHTYPLDSDLELRGIPKLDAGNNLYYDGDTYESDGTVTRKYGIVDLSTLDWSNSTPTRYISKPVSGMKPCPNSSETPNIIAEKYRTIQWSYGLSENNDAIAVSNDSYAKLYLYKGENTPAPSGYLVYELATPTTESADPFQNPQIVDDFGTESYVDSRTVPVPVGHATTYSPNLRAKLEMAPDSPADGDGDYIVRQTSGENEYVKLVKELPTLPATDGSYTLTCTVASGTPTLSWVANE